MWDIENGRINQLMLGKPVWKNCVEKSRLFTKILALVWRIEQMLYGRCWFTLSIVNCMCNTWWESQARNIHHLQRSAAMYWRSGLVRHWYRYCKLVAIVAIGWHEWFAIVVTVAAASATFYHIRRVSFDTSSFASGRLSPVVLLLQFKWKNGKIEEKERKKNENENETEKETHFPIH